MSESTGKRTLLVEKIGSVGLDMLDVIRQDFPEIKDLKADDINISSDCPIDYTETEIYINEELARKSGLFAAKTTVSVQVPEYGLSKYLQTILDTTTKKEEPSTWNKLFHKEEPVEIIYQAKIRTVFDKETLLKDWEKAEFPTKVKKMF